MSTSTVSFAGVPSWSLPGIVLECRELKGGKQDKVWAYAIKVMAMGGTYELQTRDKQLFQSVGEGQQVKAAGTFESFNGQLKLIVQRMEAVK